MKALKKHGFSALGASKSPRFQPDYNDEISEDFLKSLQRKVDGCKPEGFSLTPVCEPGW